MKTLDGNSFGWNVKCKNIFKDFYDNWTSFELMLMESYQNLNLKTGEMPMPMPMSISGASFYCKDRRMFCYHLAPLEFQS
jgi:hypothetical protein